LDSAELAGCFNRARVKLFVSDECLISRCGGIQKLFGPAFDQLNVINCDIEANQEECDSAREDRGGSLGFPLWYIGITEEYYPGAVLTHIRAVAGC